MTVVEFLSGHIFNSIALENSRNLHRLLEEPQVLFVFLEIENKT